MIAKIIVVIIVIIQYITAYVIHKLHKRFKFTKKGNMNQYQFYYNIQNKVDSDDTTQILITARDKGGLWKVGTIFLECEEIFHLLHCNSNQFRIWFRICKTIL